MEKVYEKLGKYFFSAHENEFFIAIFLGVLSYEGTHQSLVKLTFSSMEILLEVL